MVYKNDNGTTVLLTVLTFSEGQVEQDPRINADHLVRCVEPSGMQKYFYSKEQRERRNMPTGCGKLFEGGSKCPWCGNTGRFEPLREKEEVDMQQVYKN